MPAAPTPRNLDLARAERWARFNDVKITTLKAWALKRKTEAEIVAGLAGHAEALGQWHQQANGYKCWRDDPLGVALVTVLGLTAEALDAVWNDISNAN